MDFATALIKLIAAILSFAGACISLWIKIKSINDKTQQKPEELTPGNQTSSTSSEDSTDNKKPKFYTIAFNFFINNIKFFIILILLIAVTFYFATPVSNNAVNDVVNFFVPDTPTPTITPTTTPTRTITPTSIPTLTPLPPCNEKISISRPIENEQITAFRKQTGNLYWFEAEGEYELCPLAENEEPQQWSIVFITQLDSPKCILAQSFPLYEEQDGKWNATIPIADTTNFGDKDITHPIDLLFTTYLVYSEDVEHLSTSSICKFDVEDYGLSNEFLENTISDQQNIQLIKLSK